MKKVSIIGAGNVASHLGVALKAIGCEIIQVWSRTADSANALAQQLNAEAITSIATLNDKADIYILSVVDDAMPNIIKQFPFSDKLLCHTAGSVSVDILKDASDSYGVFYPLQTFSKAKQVDFSKIPLFIEGNNSHSQEVLLSLAKAISGKVTLASSKQRKYLHISAVFACNFSNYMFSIAEQMLEEQGLPFDAIRPLILETAEKAQLYSPKNVQTGPAIRDDKQTMNAHLELLSDSPQLASLYQDISKRIREEMA